MNPLMMMALGAANASASGNSDALTQMFQQMLQGQATTGPTVAPTPLTGMGNIPPGLMTPYPREHYTAPVRAPVTLPQSDQGGMRSTGNPILDMLLGRSQWGPMNWGLGGDNVGGAAGGENGAGGIGGSRS